MYRIDCRYKNRQLILNITVGSLNKNDVYYSFYDQSTRRLIRVTPDGSGYAMSLVENVDERKKLLFDNNILTNPYGFKDL